MRRLLALSLLPAVLAAQEPAPTPAQAPLATLTLAEALAEARRSSPFYRQTLNDAGPARWGVRNAYAAFLPTASVNGGMSYTGSGESNFGGTFFNQTSPSINSSYGVTLNWTLNGGVLSGPGQQKANQRAVAEDINGAEVQLRTDVTAQYLSVLQAVAQVDVARQQVDRNTVFLDLARARYQVGQASLLEVRQAEVAKGQSDVTLLRAVQASNEARLELFRRMGVTPPVEVDRIALTDSFPVTEPTFRLDDLLTLAADQNPALRALRARERAATWGVRAAKSEYLPSVSVTARWSGFTQEFTDTDLILGQTLSSAQSTAANCSFQNKIIQELPSGALPGEPNGGIIADCNAFAGLDPTGLALDPTLRSGILTDNDVFPFSFTNQPFQVGLSVSLPIFTGFSRSLRVSQARAQQQDLDESVRARGLQVQAEVHARFLALQTAHQAIGVQVASREAAREQLRLAQDRYRIGAGTSLELSDAQSAVQQAETDYVNAVYAYHQAVAALEAAVGRPLR